MGVVLRWKTPDTDQVSYDNVSIERSTSETGTYTEIATQAITDNTYFDIDGSSSNWYKIRFYEDASSTYSDYSGPIQGGTFTGYCTPEDVRDIVDISNTDLTDYQLYKVIQKSQRKINSDVMIEIKEEPVEYIDEYRQNDIDGSNTDYYVQSSWNWYIGDSDGDGEITADDVTVWIYDSSANTRSEATVSSVDEKGKIVLSSAPANNTELTISYWKCPVDPATPDNRLRDACAYLAGGLAYLKLKADEYDKISLGTLKVAKTSKAYTDYYLNYEDEIRKIKSLIKRVD